jgi:hypothetical protein
MILSYSDSLQNIKNLMTEVDKIVKVAECMSFQGKLYVDLLDDGGVAIEFNNEAETQELLIVVPPSCKPHYFSAVKSEFAYKLNGIIKKEEGLTNLVNWIRNGADHIMPKGLKF